MDFAEFCANHDNANSSCGDIDPATAFSSEFRHQGNERYMGCLRDHA